MALAEQAPLAGKRVVVTRVSEQAGDLIHQLEQLGAEVLLLPAVTFTEPQDLAPLDQAIRALASFHWVLFSSQNAVQFFAKRCRELGAMTVSDGWPPGPNSPQVAVVGPATAEAARREGLKVDYVARQFRGKALAEELGAQLTGKRVLLPRSDRAGSDLPTALRAEGAEVLDVVAYHTGMPNSFDPGVIEAIRRGQVDVLTLFSPSAFHHLVEELGMETLRRNAGQVVLAAIGTVTAGAVREAGLTVEIEAPEATAAALVAAITRYFLERFPSGVKSP